MMRRKDPTEWRKKFDAWKSGTPTSELFNLPKYDDGTDDEITVDGGELENVVVTPTKQDKKILNLFKKAIPNKRIRNTIYEDLDFLDEFEPFANEILSQNEKVRNIVSLWQMSGNPSTYNGIFDFFIRRPSSNERRPNYKAWNNSIGNIGFNDDLGAMDDYLAELSHAYQFSKYAPKKVRENLLTRFLSLPGDIKINGKDGYRRPGNLEYNAHSIIEPAIQDYVQYEKYPSVLVLNDRINVEEQLRNAVETAPKKHDNGKSIKPLRKYDTGWWDDLKDKIPGYAVKAAKFVAPTTFNTIATIVGKTSEMLHDRDRLLRAAHSSSRGGDTNVESFVLNSNPKDDLIYTGSFELPLDQKGNTVFKADPNSSEKSRYKANKDRDLVKYAITGEKGSITEAEPITVNDHTYDRTIDGVIFPYSNITFPKQLLNVVDSIASSPKPIMSLGPNTGYGNGDGTFSYIDNVANHSGVFKKTKKGFEFVPFDYWDFAGNYKYAEKLPKVNELFESLILPNEKYPNSGPFAIRQKGIPIVFDDHENINFLNWYSTLKRGSDTNSATQSMINAIREYKGYDKGKSIHIKPANRGKLTALKKRTGKSEAELYNDGNPAHKKMVVFARNARRWRH